MFERELHVLSNLASLVPDNGSILEIGSCFGRSTHALYIGKKSTVSLTALDKWGSPISLPKGTYEGSEDLLTQAIDISVKNGNNSKYGFEFCLGKDVADNITIIQQNSIDFKPDKDFNLVFIDGGHSYDVVSNDISMFTHLHDTLIICDDANTNSWDVVRAIWDKKQSRVALIPAGPDIKLCALIPSAGYWKNLELAIYKILTN